MILSVTIVIAQALLPLAAGATITGTVMDASGKPLEGVRIDHIGKIVVVARTDLAVKPSPDEVRTDADGNFRVLTDVPAVVIRTPGYQSQRVRLSGDSQLSPRTTRTMSPLGTTLRRRMDRKASKAAMGRRTISVLLVIRTCGPLSITKR